MIEFAMGVGVFGFCESLAMLVTSNYHVEPYFFLIQIFLLSALFYAVSFSLLESQAGLMRTSTRGMTCFLSLSGLITWMFHYFREYGNKGHPFAGQAAFPDLWGTWHIQENIFVGAFGITVFLYFFRFCWVWCPGAGIIQGIITILMAPILFGLSVLGMEPKS